MNFKPKEDTRSVFGKRIDTLIGLLLVWLVSFLLLVNLTGRPVVALVLSLPLLVVEALLLKKLWKLREQGRQFQQLLWLAGQKFTEDISKMDPQKEFQPYVRDILARLPGFQELSLKSGRENEGDISKQGMDLEGVYKGIPVAVRCRYQDKDKKIAPEDIQAFAGALDLRGYKNGLFVAISDFSTGVLPVVKDAARKGIKIKLVNRYRLMELARQTGFSAFRGEESAPRVPFRTAGERHATTLADFLDSAFGSRKKARSYFLYGLLLYGGYILLKGSTMLSLIYLFFAALNFLMSAGSLYFCKTLEDTDPLEGLGSKN